MLVTSYRTYNESTAISYTCRYHRCSDHCCHCPMYLPEPSKSTASSALQTTFPSFLPHLLGKEAKHPAPKRQRQSWKEERWRDRNYPLFFKWRYYQIAWCKKLLPPPSHYVYLARSQYVEQFSDSATEAEFSTCTDYSDTGTTASSHAAWVTEPSPTAGRKFFASREVCSALHIFTSMGVYGTGSNSISTLVKIFLPTVAECSMVLWTLIDFCHVRSWDTSSLKKAPTTVWTKAAQGKWQCLKLSRSGTDGTAASDTCFRQPQFPPSSSVDHYVPQRAESGSNAPSFDTQTNRDIFHICNA